MPQPLHVAYVGNFDPPHSTETHVAQALERNGHLVTRAQENRHGMFAQLADVLTAQPAGPGQTSPIDVVLWTRTGWDWPAVGYPSAEAAHDDQRRLLAAARDRQVPVVGYHLDRWWGLNRAPQVVAEPFFAVDLLVTADGGHDDLWASAGVNHLWMPPGVSLAECERVGQARDDLRAQVGFVGSWRSYHREWRNRRHLVRWLQNTYDKPVRPRPPYQRLRIVEGGYRGQDLADLYASIDVLVGDSCLVPRADGSPATRYWSDRIPETLGRGGFLIHPDVEGLRDYFPPGVLVTVPLGDFDALGACIDRWLDEPELRREIAERGRQHVMEHHTYEVRMAQLVAHLDTLGWLR